MTRQGKLPTPITVSSLFFFALQTKYQALSFPYVSIRAVLTQDPALLFIPRTVLDFAYSPPLLLQKKELK